MQSSPSTPAELTSLAKQAKTYSRVAVVMLAGGHFSAAIFDGYGTLQFHMNLKFFFKDCTASWQNVLSFSRLIPHEQDLRQSNVTT